MAIRIFWLFNTAIWNVVTMTRILTQMFNYDFVNIFFAILGPFALIYQIKAFYQKMKE
ncbi:hypothetical protein [Sharpea azabuensis]|uniref:Uncharacterized protein n=1 Tax=Sharpea azabuensis TaxID=322505 RepID=A0A1H6QVJ3_9FIRM|nr:hypothetical protein [Sharpea azabuensis]MDD6513232.1 hypothetical protein [Sharpea azabuensis]SEI47639.1 hypothetical protein SAMN04487834_100561 [Sharpea azabuensis]